MLRDYVQSRKIVGKLPPGCVRNEWMTISNYTLNPKEDDSCLRVNGEQLHKSYTNSITAIHDQAVKEFEINSATVRDE